MFLLKSTSDAQYEIENCVSVLFNRVRSIHETSSVKPSASVIRASAAAAATASSTLVSQSSKAASR